MRVYASARRLGGMALQNCAPQEHDRPLSDIRSAAFSERTSYHILHYGGQSAQRGRKRFVLK